MMTSAATTDHSGDERILEAAEWLASTPRGEIEGALVPAVRRRFGLDPMDAVAVIRMSDLILHGRAN